MSYVTWPLSHNKIRRSSLNHTFGMVRNKGKRAHQGWDFEAPAGTQAFAIADGTVVRSNNGGAYGQTLCIEFQHGAKKLYAFYAHMQSVVVKPGDTVKAHQKVGRCGMSGRSEWAESHNFDPHLHFEIRTRQWGTKGLAGRISPLDVFGRCPLRTPVLAIQRPLVIEA